MSPAPGIRRSDVRRVAAVAVLVVAALAVAWALGAFGGDAYRLHARFADAGQLIPGADVRVAGRRVGAVDRIRLADDGRADVELRIDDASLTPLRDGTRVAIRAVGQAGVANRYVELSPGPTTASALRDGALLPPSQATGIVDLDALFGMLDPPARANLRRLIARSADVFAGSGAAPFNRMLVRLDPAMAAVSGVTNDLAHDDRALATLVRDGGIAAQALGSRRRDLEDAVTHTAQVLNAVADTRAPLADALRRAPAVLRQATRTLRDTGDTVTALRPALRDVPPAAGPLREVLERVDGTLGDARPVVRRLRAQLAPLRASLAGLVPLARPAVEGLRAAGDALSASAPIVRGLRIYGADFVLGVTNGLAGIITSNYNADGHYGRLNFVENPQTLLAGMPASVLSRQPLLPQLLGTRTGVTALCPGGNEPPAPDGSNPWVPDRSLCDPASSIPASVNEP